MKVAYRFVGSLWISALLLGVTAPSMKVWAATETGGYPWADALLVRAASYDWGYTSCQPAMRAAQTCNAHVTTKLGQKYYESDPWRYDVRNCTSYVAWRINSETGVAIAGWGNANRWDTAAKNAGYSVDKHPAIGSIAMWEGRYGHVAYVVMVNPDQSVNVEQYNKAGTGEFSRQSRVRADHYIHVADKPDTPNQPATVIASQKIPEPAQPQVVTTKLHDTAVQLDATNTGSEPFILQPLQPSTTLPTTPGVNYQVALDPNKQEVNVYAVAWQKSKSGSVELYRSNGADGNSTWAQQWQTELPLESEVTRQYLLADSNADSVLDLYVIANGTIQVLDGAHDYKNLDASANDQEKSKISINPSKESNLQLADYDGDGSLDLFALSKVSTNATIDIYDGSKQFSQPLARWHAPVASDVTDFIVGDHDRDGRIDIYQIGSTVTVLSAITNYSQVLSSWKPEVKEQLFTAQHSMGQ